MLASGLLGEIGSLWWRGRGWAGLLGGEAGAFLALWVEGESEFVLLLGGLTLEMSPLLIAKPPARETPKPHRGRVFSLAVQKMTKALMTVQSLTA